MRYLVASMILCFGMSYAQEVVIQLPVEVIAGEENSGEEVASVDVAKQLTTDSKCGCGGGSGDSSNGKGKGGK